MATPEQLALGKLDGRDPDHPNYPPFPWTPTRLYGAWDFGQTWVSRTAGADPGKAPGDVWNTPSECDKNTVLAEILTKKFRGKYTVLHMLAAVFAVDVLGEDPAAVLKAMNL